MSVAHNHHDEDRPVADKFAKLLREARERKGLSQPELGAAVGGYTQSAVSVWELGKAVPSIEIIRKLERALGMTPGTLLGAAGYPVKLTAMSPEDAIEADRTLKEDEKSAMLTTLRAFRQRRGRSAS